MPYRFNPNTNPFADDLLRLSQAPRSRFSEQERRAIATIFAGKMYRLSYDDSYSFYEDEYIAYRYGIGRPPIALAIFFDSEFRDERSSPWIGMARDGWKLIVVSVGEHGVVELLNGSWTKAAGKQLSNALARLSADETADVNDESDRVLPLSDEEAQRDYDGIGDGKNGDGGDGDGGAGGNGPDGQGPGDGSGRGGTRELLTHPVLLSVDGDLFDSILELT